MIDAGKKFTDVTLQNPNCLVIIARNFPSKAGQAAQRAMSTLSQAAGIRIMNKFLVKI